MSRVCVRLNRRYGCVNKGEIAAYPEAEALALVDGGHASFVTEEELAKSRDPVVTDSEGRMRPATFGDPRKARNRSVEPAVKK